ncbi:MAG: hypothetical protein ABI193_26255 [Minicystis sp.]
MELEEDALIVIRHDSEFPREDVEAIGRRLSSSGALVAGYVPPDVGMLSIPAIQLGQTLDQTETIVVVDRNIASRMAGIARNGLLRPLDKPTAIAVDVMAFAQAVNFKIDPTIAFHELGNKEGNEVACEELAWFQVADAGNAQAWIDLAQGRIDHLPPGAPLHVEAHDLAFPLERWRRNYIVALKVAELELSDRSPIMRAQSLFQWMVEDFFLAGPAAIFATMYFSPFARKRRLLKQLRSENRERALAGLKNAAWDMTHLSELSRNAKKSIVANAFYIFATADAGLAEIAPVLIIDADDDAFVDTLSPSLEGWWPKGDARILGQSLHGHVKSIEGREPPGPSFKSDDPIQDLINEGEARVRAWRNGKL